MTPDYKMLYRTYIKGVKQVGNDPNQFTGFCPFHDDKKNRSFSFNGTTGLSNCFVGCFQGNAYQFAEKVGHLNPKEFINDFVQFNKKSSQMKMPFKTKEELWKIAENYHKNLSPEEIEERPILKGMLVGRDEQGRYTFPYHDIDGNIIGIKHHKGKNGESPYWEGDGKCKFYGLQLIKGYDHDEPLIICEGENDCLWLRHIGYQATTGSAGAGSIPKDLSSISGFNEYIIIYDNDSAGNDGAGKMASNLQMKFPSSEIKIAHWREELPIGYDITDDIKTNFTEVKNALESASKYKRGKIGGFTEITGFEASIMDVPEVEWIADGLLPKKFKAILGGTTGSNKSYFAMELGMRVADGKADFLGYLIPNQLKILFVDMEVGRDELVRRFQRLSKTLQFKNNDNWKMITKEGGFSNVYDDIELALKGYQPDLLIIDNLYSSFGAVNISKNEVLKPILNKIDVLKSKFNLSILLVHHFIKSGNDMGLVIERLQGGAALQNWMEHCILISKTNNQDIRLMRFGKSRGTMHSEEVYGLRWNSENYTLEMMGIIKNWRRLLTSDRMCRQWESVLNEMNDNFTSSDWLNVVVDKYKMGKKTAFSWLLELQTIGLIEKIKHGQYRKTKLKFINVE